MSKTMGLLPSTRKGKRYMTKINNRTYHFGAAEGSTYIDHHDKKLRSNYIKRHHVNEDWTKVNPGSLSRWVLWGNHTSLEANIKHYMKIFDLHCSGKWGCHQKRRTRGSKSRTK